jgi:hypothetical protein
MDLYLVAFIVNIQQFFRRGFIAVMAFVSDKGFKLLQG